MTMQAFDPAPSIIGIGGTVRPSSSTETALACSLRRAEALGARTRIFGGEFLAKLPLFDRRFLALRSIVHAMRGWPPPFGAALSSTAGLFDEAGTWRDPKDAWALDTVAEQVMEFARIRSGS